MKKTKLTRHMSLLLVFAILFTEALSTEKVQAAAIKKQYEFYVYSKDPKFEKRWEEIIINFGEHETIPKNIKSSNEKVFTAKSGSGYFKDTVVVHPEKVQKASKATLSFQYGEKELSTTIIVRPWKNPVKSLKLGKKDITKCFDKSGVYWLGKQKKSLEGKMKIQLKSGWAMKQIKYRNKNGVKTVKNGAKILLDPKIETDPEKVQNGTASSKICVKLENTKTNEIVVLEYWYSSYGKTENRYYNNKYINMYLF